MKSLVASASVLLLSLIANAADPYIELSQPSNVLQVHVNLNGYKPTSRFVKKTEIHFGDGSFVTNK